MSVTLYTYADFKGAEKTFSSGDYDFGDNFNVWKKDKLASFIVAPNTTITLFRNNKFIGPSQTFKATTKPLKVNQHVPNDWVDNNNISYRSGVKVDAVRSIRVINNDPYRNPILYTLLAG